MAGPSSRPAAGVALAGGWVEPEFFDRQVAVTWHALEQFAARAQPPALDEAYLRAALRDLVVAEGRLVLQPPRWARSSNLADCYIEIGRFLLLICRRDAVRPDCFACVTIVNGRSDTSWAVALARGWIRLSPPPPRPVPLTQLAYHDRRRQLERDSRGAVPAPAKPPLTSASLPVTPARWRARRAEIRGRRADSRQRREQWLEAAYAELDCQQAQAIRSLELWERELWPAYALAWRAARDAAREALSGG